MIPKSIIQSDRDVIWSRNIFLQNALAKVYPLAEYKEYMRHLFSNFKKHYQGIFLCLDFGVLLEHTPPPVSML
jgi:hypothetical protein